MKRGNHLSGIEGETLIGNLEANHERETSVEFEEGVPYVHVKETVEENDEEESEKEIVDLEDESVEKTMPVEERNTRRTTRRRRMLEELDEPTQPRKLQFGDSEKVGKAGDGNSKTQELHGVDEDLTEAKEKWLAAEHKRKGKLEAKPLTKKHMPASSTLATEEPMPETIRVPFAKELKVPDAASEAEDGDEAEQTEEPSYEMTEVLVTKKLLEAMAEFDDPRRAHTYKDR